MTHPDTDLADMRKKARDEFDAAVARCKEHLERIEAFSDCHSRSMFTQADKDLITLLDENKRLLDRLERAESERDRLRADLEAAETLGAQWAVEQIETAIRAIRGNQSIVIVNNEIDSIFPSKEINAAALKGDRE